MSRPAKEPGTVRCAVCEQPVRKPDMTYLVPLDADCRTFVDVCYQSSISEDWVAFNRRGLIEEASRAVELARRRLLRP